MRNISPSTCSICRQIILDRKSSFEVSLYRILNKKRIGGYLIKFLWTKKYVVSYLFSQSNNKKFLVRYQILLDKFFCKIFRQALLYCQLILTIYLLSHPPDIIERILSPILGYGKQVINKNRYVSHFHPWIFLRFSKSPPND